MGKVRRRERGSWQIDYRRTVNGQSFGRKEVVKGKKAYAEEVLTARMTEIDRYLRLGEEPGDRVAVLMDEVLDGLVTYYKIKGRRSLDRAHRSVESLKEFFSGKRADKVTADDIEKWRQWRYTKLTVQRGTRPAPATVNRELAALKTAFSRAVKNRKLTYNPALHVELDREDNHREQMWTDEDFRSVWQIAKPYQRVLLGLLRFSGLRRGEALTATFNRIDDRCILTIPPEIEKTGRGRKVPIPPLLTEYIFDLRESGQSHLVWYRRRPLKSVRGSIVGLQRRARLPGGLWTHDFRRSFEHHARSIRIDERVIRAIIGHSQGSDAHARYVVVRDEDLVEAGEKMQLGLLKELLSEPIRGQTVDKCSTDYKRL